MNCCILTSVKSLAVLIGLNKQSTAILFHKSFSTACLGEIGVRLCINPMVRSTSFDNNRSVNNSLCCALLPATTLRISKNCFQTVTGYGSGYPKRFYRYSEDSDFWKKLHIAESFINFLQKHLFSFLCHASLSMVQSLYRNVIPFPHLNLLNGHTKLVSISLFLMWQDMALSVACTLGTLLAAYLYLD